MYKIIGADQKEYGPVSADLLRQWIAEGRVSVQTQVLPEGATEWKTVGDLPEFADLLHTMPSAATVAQPGAGVVPVEVVLGRDFALDIGDCISRSWALVKQRFWPIVGITLLVMVVEGIINQLVGLFSRPAISGMLAEHRVSPGAIAIVLGTSLVSAPVYTVLTAGLFKYYLKLIRGQPAEIGDAFAGFSSAFGRLVLLSFVSGLLSLLGLALCVLPGIYLVISWTFAIPLVIDRGMGFWEAMEFSRKVVSKHWFLMFAFVLVVGLIAACGVLACCIGLLVSIPIGWVAMMYAYEDIFGRQGP